MTDTESSYGLWTFVVVNSAVFIMFAFSFFKPRSPRDWRGFGLLSAFFIALFTEMYGFPLTIFLLSGWLQSNWPDVNWYAHNSGHLPEMLMGWRSNPHFGPFHLLSFLLIGFGLWLMWAAWRHIWVAQRHGLLAMVGPYAHLRHPQYVGFILVLTGFVLQWPTLLTLAMYPVLVWMYARLAKHEDATNRKQFGGTWDRYAKRVPAFIPRLARSDLASHRRDKGGTDGA